MNKIALIIFTSILSGCAHYDNLVYMKDVNINNYATSNYVANPCELWLNDRCLFFKPTVRNPDRPLVDK